jgi:demethylmenaquinone methyltransferase/2-methoxy-6-polyprenyl-1,4-benzoquinol methylase
VEALFNAVAPRYDRLNDLLSLGLHRQWKRQLLSWLSPQPDERWLDLCCGTGDLALALGRKLRPAGSVLGLDAAAAPLTLAAARASREPWLPVQWMQADALDTGLPDQDFDGVVMAYGLRNLADPFLGFQEMARVLKPGGRAAVLDFNRLPEGSAAAAFQQTYLRRVVVPVAAGMGLADQYSYLETSVKQFLTGAEQESQAVTAGFTAAQHRPLVGGQMGVLLLIR